MAITLEKLPSGYIVWKDKVFKLAVITTSQHNGVYIKDKVGEHMVHEPMATDSWTIHWTSPVMPVEELLAVVDALPKEAA